MNGDLNVHEIIRERFSKLPELLRNAITSADVPEKLRTIATKHRLHIDQGQLLENETYLVMLGLDTTENFTRNIKKELGIDEIMAREITSEVQVGIFLPIREFLKTKTDTESVPEVPHASVPQPTAPAINKFQGIVRSEKQEIELSGRPLPQKNAPYRMDPYREPTN